MSLHNNLPEAMQLLIVFLKDHEGKEVWFLLADGFVKGTLDRAPNDPKEEFTLTNPTHYSPSGKEQELNQVSFTASQILGWGGDSMDFLAAKN